MSLPLFISFLHPSHSHHPLCSVPEKFSPLFSFLLYCLIRPSSPFPQQKPPSSAISGTALLTGSTIAKPGDRQPHTQETLTPTHPAQPVPPFPPTTHPPPRPATPTQCYHSHQSHHGGLWSRWPSPPPPTASFTPSSDTLDSTPRYSRQEVQYSFSVLYQSIHAWRSNPLPS